MEDKLNTRDGNQLNTKPERTLPDENVCRAKWAVIGKVADCLVQAPRNCAYALSFGHGFLCHHPDRQRIVEHTRRCPRVDQPST